MKITEFVKGDIITRVKPIRYVAANDYFSYDNSYIGYKLEFLGIVNGLIYFKEKI
jgi:hypothetical protein